MLLSLTSGMSGLQQFQQQMDVIGNNVANVNTTAYKASYAKFADTLSMTLADASGLRPLQVGTGVSTSSIDTRYAQGGFRATNNPSDLAVNGEGFFMVRDAASGAEFATRDGAFLRDSAGYLTSLGGLRVQGFSDAGVSTRGDVRIDATGAPGTAAPGATYDSFRVDSSGRVLVRLSDGTEFVRGQVLLQQFRDPASLEKEGNNLYTNLAAAGPLGQTAVPAAGGLGRIESGKLEMSNVDLTTEFTSLIATQRAFQASARMVTTSDEVLQEVVNLVR